MRPVLLFISIGISIVVLSAVFYIYKVKRQAEYDSKKLSWVYKLEYIDPNRTVRQIHRSPGMQASMDIIAEVFQTALKKSNQLNELVEIRFYQSERALDDPNEYGGEAGYFCFGLQAFRKNEDNSVSPLGEMHRLPDNFVFYPDGVSYTMTCDVNKHILSFDYDRYASGVITLCDLNNKLIPTEDRVIDFLDGKLYFDGGDDIGSNVAFRAITPNLQVGESSPVRP